MPTEMQSREIQVAEIKRLGIQLLDTSFSLARTAINLHCSTISDFRTRLPFKNIQIATEDSHNELKDSITHVVVFNRNSEDPDMGIKVPIQKQGYFLLFTSSTGLCCTLDIQAVPELAGPKSDNPELPRSRVVTPPYYISVAIPEVPAHAQYMTVHEFRKQRRNLINQAELRTVYDPISQRFIITKACFKNAELKQTQELPNPVLLKEYQQDFQTFVTKIHTTYQQLKSFA